MNIYVGNMPYTTTEDDLRNLFGNYGEVLSVKLITDRESGKPRGYGFIEMEDSCAEQAIEALHEYEMQGRKMQVNQAREREKRDFNGGNRNRFQNRRSY